MQKLNNWSIKSKIFFLVLLVATVLTISLVLIFFSSSSQMIEGDINKKILLVSVVAIIISSILGLFIAEKISQPIIELKDTFNQGAKGDLDVRAIVESEDEIGQAARSFNKMMEVMKNLTFNDSLTGLPNLSLFKSKLELAIEHSGVGKGDLVLFAIGINQFKSVNYKYSHQIGDQILKKMAARLNRKLGSDSLITRIGDEFYISYSKCLRKGSIYKFTKEILDYIDQSYYVHDNIIYINSSLGIAVHPKDGETSDQLMRNARTGMYFAKNKDHSKIAFYSADIEDKLSEQKRLEKDLTQALKEEQFTLHYQPLIDANSKEVAGMEALIRWEHPEIGLISPGKFIPLAEENGMIVDIGSWVLEKACWQLRDWHEMGYTNLYISVNVDPQQFLSTHFMDEVREILEESQVNPGKLELEITEGVTMENIEYTINTLNELRHLGVRIAIDDFGTGYSSLSYLKEFAITTLKIDKSFLDNLFEDNTSEAIIDTIIAMGNNLKLKTLAEGVETREQMEFLIKRQCNLLQGYYFSKPLPATALTDFISKKIS